MLLILVEFRSSFRFIGESFGMLGIFLDFLGDALDHWEKLAKVFFILVHFISIRL